MGLIAVVHCNCYKEGKTKAPPFAPELLRIDEHGSVELLSPYNADTFSKFHRWQESACSHPRMGLADFYLNYFGFRQVQWALSTIDADSCRAMRKIMPEDQMQWSSADLASHARRELPDFVELASKIESAFLIESDNGNVLHSYAPAYRGVFSSGQSVELGIDMQGFFIAQSDDEKLFRAMRFEQTLLESERTHKSADGEVEYRDLETGKSVRIRSAISREVNPGVRPMLLEISLTLARGDEIPREKILPPFCQGNGSRSRGC